MKSSALIGPMAICLSFGLAAPLSAATPPATDATAGATPAAKAPSAASAMTGDAAAVRPAAACLADLRSFSGKMGHDGYWLGGSEYGYGYPMGGYGYGYNYPIGAYPASGGYSNARPGYEVRTLLASAKVLAQQGQQQPCETVLGTARTLYGRYVTQMQSRGISTYSGPNWHQQEIAAALPVTDQKTAFRSDQLLDTDVLSLAGESLGSIHDIIMSPETGKIAYLVVARGGLFGIDQKYVPVPWGDFKATPDTAVLVLNTTKATLQAAPQVSDDKFAVKGQFEQESKQVDDYWKTQLASKASN